MGKIMRLRYNIKRTVDEKIAILDELKQMKALGAARGEQAAYLRSIGLDTAHITIWRRVLRRQGKLPERLYAP